MSLSEQIENQRRNLQDSLSILDISLNSQSLESSNFLENGTHSSQKAASKPIFHLDISKCLDAQSQNETIEVEGESFDECEQFFQLRNEEEQKKRKMQTSKKPSGLDQILESDEQQMMNFHKELLYAEFRELIRNRPEGGDIVVDSTKLRILLDLMRTQSDRLEQQVRSFLALGSPKSHSTSSMQYVQPGDSPGESVTCSEST